MLQFREVFQLVLAYTLQLPKADQVVLPYRLQFHNPTEALPCRNLHMAVVVFVFICMFMRTFDLHWFLPQTCQQS